MAMNHRLYDGNYFLAFLEFTINSNTKYPIRNTLMEADITAKPHTLNENMVLFIHYVYLPLHILHANASKNSN